MLSVLLVAGRGGGLDALAACAALTAMASALASAAAAYWVLRPLRVRWQIERSVSRTMAKYSLVAWVSTLGGLLFSSADRIVVGAALGPAAAGVYAICVGISVRLNQLAGSLTQVLVPFASTRRAASQGGQIGTVFVHISRLLACLLAGISVLIVLWADVLLQVWISPQFAQEYANVLRVIVICYGVFSMNAPAHHLAYGLGRPQSPAILGAIGAIGTLSLIVLLAPLGGLSGAAGANLAYSIVLLVYAPVANDLHLDLRTTVFRSLGPPLLALILYSVTGYLFGWSLQVAIVGSFAATATFTWLAVSGGGATFLWQTWMVGNADATTGLHRSASSE